MLVDGRFMLYPAPSTCAPWSRQRKFQSKPRIQLSISRHISNELVRAVLFPCHVIERNDAVRCAELERVRAFNRNAERPT